MSGYNLEKQTTGFGGIMEFGCMTVAADSAAASFASKTVAIPTRLSKVISGIAWADATSNYGGYPVSVCAGGWLDFTFSDSTMTGFRYVAVGY